MRASSLATLGAVLCVTALVTGCATAHGSASSATSAATPSLTSKTSSAIAPHVSSANQLTVRLIPASQMKTPPPVPPHFVHGGEELVPIPGASLLTSITEWTGTINKVTYLVVTGQLTMGGANPSGPPEIVVASAPDTVTGQAQAVAHWTKFDAAGTPKLLSVSKAGIATVTFSDGSSLTYNITTHSIVISGTSASAN